MKMYEYTQKKNFNELDTDAKIFTAKVIMKEVRQIAQENNISEELAYMFYCKGLFGSDRVVG